MGLIKAALGAAGGVLADQWKEYFYCESIPENVMAVKGQRRVFRTQQQHKGKRKHHLERLRRRGGGRTVHDHRRSGQGRGAVRRAGRVRVRQLDGALIFSGQLGTSIVGTFKNIGKRFTFGGEAIKDQRVYYFNTKGSSTTKYGTPSRCRSALLTSARASTSVPSAASASTATASAIRFCSTNVCGNVGENYTRDRLDGQLKTELLTALQPALPRSRNGHPLLRRSPATRWSWRTRSTRCSPESGATCAA